MENAFVKKFGKDPLATSQNARIIAFREVYAQLGEFASATKDSHLMIARFEPVNMAVMIMEFVT